MNYMGQVRVGTTLYELGTLPGRYLYCYIIKL